MTVASAPAMPFRGEWIGCFGASVSCTAAGQRAVPLLLPQIALRLSEVNKIWPLRGHPLHLLHLTSPLLPSSLPPLLLLSFLPPLLPSSSPPFLPSSFPPFLPPQRTGRARVSWKRFIIPTDNHTHSLHTLHCLVGVPEWYRWSELSF